jgi:hypothetical protein
VQFTGAAGFTYNFENQAIDYKTGIELNSIYWRSHLGRGIVRGCGWLDRAGAMSNDINGTPATS